MIHFDDTLDLKVAVACALKTFERWWIRLFEGNRLSSHRSDGIMSFPSPTPQ